MPLRHRIYIDPKMGRSDLTNRQLNNEYRGGTIHCTTLTFLGIMLAIKMIQINLLIRSKDEELPSQEPVLRPLPLLRELPW
jgi:hypothetical protein